MLSTKVVPVRAPPAPYEERERLLGFIDDVAKLLPVDDEPRVEQARRDVLRLADQRIMDTSQSQRLSLIHI